jgi:XTP/dITP diphosphohydrolase
VIDLVLATRNWHKVQEIQAMLGKDFSVQSLAQYPQAPDLVEDADTFAGNATRKATQLAQWLAGRAGFHPGRDVFVLADDSGLEVDALNGAPGVHSARFAATNENAPDAANLEKLLSLLRDVPLDKRAARFRCTLALVRRDSVEVFEGACEGTIISEARGTGGFGYDPVFVPNGYSETFAQLGEHIKNQISHRARALQKLKAYFSSLSQARGGPVPPKA